MIEKFHTAVLKAIEGAKAETLLQLVQLKCASMQELGERHTMLKAMHEGLDRAAALAEREYQNLLGKPEAEAETPEKGPYQ